MKKVILFLFITTILVTSIVAQRSVKYQSDENTTATYITDATYPVSIINTGLTGGYALTVEGHEKPANGWNSLIFLPSKRRKRGYVLVDDVKCPYIRKRRVVLITLLKFSDPFKAGSALEIRF